AVAGGPVGEGRSAIRWEPLGGVGGGAVVIAQRASQDPAASWLSEAAARIGTTLDLTQTAIKVTDVAVPRFADATSIFGSERLLAAGDLTSPWPKLGDRVVVRRLATPLAGWPHQTPNRPPPPSPGL